MIADAYKGDQIKETITDFLKSSAGKNTKVIPIQVDKRNVNLNSGGEADLIVYVGHNGLMDFELKEYPEGESKKDVIILACKSKPYFKASLKKTGANPLLWTSGFMSPEAYTLKAAIDGWVQKESSGKIQERAEKAYHKYQKRFGTTLNNARKLLATGWKS